MEKTIKPSDLQAEAQRLIKAGLMPSADKVLGVVSEMRQKYHPKIANARQATAPPKPAESKAPVDWAGPVQKANIGRK